MHPIQLSKSTLQGSPIDTAARKNWGGSERLEIRFRPLRSLGAAAISSGVNRAPQTHIPLAKFVSAMLGLPAWGVKQGHGSFLTFEFGEQKLEMGEPRQSGELGRGRTAYVHGEWHLWIYCCHWRVLHGGTQLAWSEDADEVIGRAAAKLNGQKLIAVDVDPAEGRSIFTFDLGGSLETWPYGAAPTAEQWFIYGSAEVFAYRADGLYSKGSGETLSDLNRWLPLG